MNSNDMELLSGWFYSESYDMKINDPTKEFLLAMDIYLDKTGKSAGITSSCGELVIWTTTLLTSEVQEHPYAWNLLGLIADLESGLTEITQPCIHTCDGLFICQLYSLPVTRFA
jgi:hypothetical protein